MFMTREHVDSAFFKPRRKLKKLGYSEAQIAKAFGMSVADLRAAAALYHARVRAAEESRARRLREEGFSVSEIGRIMKMNESSVRSLLRGYDEARRE